MKKLLLTASLLTALATPALAQSYNPNIGSGNLVPPPGGVYGEPWSAAGSRMPGYAARAYAQPESEAVIAEGKVVGHDPDPNVRLMLRRDYKYE